MIYTMNIKAEANNKEKEIARRYGFKQTLQSGAGLQKGDMYDDFFMIDVKYTKAETQCTIKKADIEKMYEDAATYNPGKIPALLVSMHDYNVFVISPDDFFEFSRLLEKERTKT